MSGLLIVLRTSLRIQRGDIASPIVMAVLPLVLTPFLIPGAQAQLQASGYPEATGAEQVVPGFAALFGFLAVQQIVTGFGREHQWGTWDRLRAAPISALALVLGRSTACLLVQQIVTGFGREHQWGTWDRLRAAPISALALVLGRSTACLLVQLAQLTFVVAAGALLFGYRPQGSLLSIALVLLVLAVMLVAFGVMLVAVFRSSEHALIAASLGGMVMAGIGGALAPVPSFPAWAQLAARGSPAYWALDALRTLSLEHSGFAEAAPALGAMIGFTTAFALVATLYFRPAKQNRGIN
ncbi:MAG: ABC transporter permease [Canibacter sp.]